MRRSGSKPLTTEVLYEQVEFLLKTLLRDDLFGEEVSLSEAERLLENSLSAGFVEYCAFLKRHGLVKIDRSTNTVRVLDKGRHLAGGAHEPAIFSALSTHFSGRLESSAQLSQDNSASDGGPPHASEEIVDDVYVRYEAIGEGSLGTVYRAKNLRLSREVALKQMKHVFEYVTYIPREELRGRLKAAALAQAALRHPHVLTVVDLNFELDEPCVMTAFAAGGNLRDRLVRAAAEPAGVLPFDIISRLLVQAAYGLHYAHQHGVVHGNLKPENVLFDHSGNVLLSDFGAARVTEKSGNTSGPPVYVGTGSPSYMAPEQLHGGRAGQASDIYALGILLYELCTGQLPGRRSKMPSELNPDVPPGLDDVFDKMTPDGLDERYATMDEVLDALYTALPRATVLERGSLVLYEHDPYPPPAKSAAAADPDGDHGDDDSDESSAEGDGEDDRGAAAASA